MRIEILTLFPAETEAVLGESIIGRARKNGIIYINSRDIRDYTLNKQKQTDDYPYGGGYGMVMYADALFHAYEAAKKDLLDAGCDESKLRTIYMSPQGSVFSQAKARALLEYEGLILVCGHYEGIDYRFIEECVDEEISLGDYVISGGELAAMAVADAVCRMVPGVLASSECYEDESHWNGRLEYPQYTRPEVWHEKQVPKILLSGHHANIKKWRKKQSLIITGERRPDLFEKFPLSDEEKKLLAEKD